MAVFRTHYPEMHKWALSHTKHRSAPAEIRSRDCSFAYFRCARAIMFLGPQPIHFRDPSWAGRAVKTHAAIFLIE
jgi:hypothetical protein